MEEIVVIHVKTRCPCPVVLGTPLLFLLDALVLLEHAHDFFDTSPLLQATNAAKLHGV